ncbi:MAG: NFACT RNA binding domain-containing protein, partial [Candidatus Aenigmarchaeota archaeon]|nr:NFACT RNA binding domain-containing protein [Candidatus Aenigmarchaeota archaeon]MDI6722199.1 NFACT RNA binding domain-containing protein [Candidatus Aenigmarchaeota archaeon]
EKKNIAIEKMKKKEKELREKAEKIYEKFDDISLLLEKAKERSAKIEIDGMNIEIDRSLSLQKNAEKYFEESKKIRKKVDRAKNVVVKEKDAGKTEMKKEWYHKFRWFFTSDKFLVIAGKDAKTNNDIIRKRVEARDIVIHAEIHGAAFAVVKCEKNAATKNALEEAMQFAACHSKAWAMGIGSIDVYWVKPGQVSKQASGMGTFNIIGEKNYIRRMELKIGAGFVGNEFQILPYKTFENLSVRCVPIYTGDMKARDLAKKIKEKLKSLYIDKSKEIEGMPLSAIESRIPYGRGSV